MKLKASAWPQVSLARAQKWLTWILDCASSLGSNSPVLFLSSQSNSASMNAIHSFFVIFPLLLVRIDEKHQSTDLILAQGEQSSDDQNPSTGYPFCEHFFPERNRDACVICEFHANQNSSRNVNCPVRFPSYSAAGAPLQALKNWRKAGTGPPND